MGVDRARPDRIHTLVYCEDIQSNLLSLPVLFDLSYEFTMTPGHSASIWQCGQLVVNTVHEGFLFRLAIPSPQARIMIAQGEDEVDGGDNTDVEEEDLIVWHRKLVHLNGADVKKLEKMAVRVKIKKGTEIGICRDCLAGKQHRTPSHEPSLRSSVANDLIHMDSSGKIDPPAIGGYNYYGLFIDDATRMTYFAPLKSNGAQEMLEHFIEFRKLINTKLSTKIKCIHTDNGTEYMGELDKFLKKKGIKHELMAAYHPDQNSVTERANRMIMERVKAIIADGEFLKNLWAEITATVVYLKNRSPTSALDNKMPFEAWHGKKPDLSHLHILGCDAFVHIPKEKRVKLDSHTEKGSWLDTEVRTNGRFGFLKGRKLLYPGMLCLTR